MTTKQATDAEIAAYTVGELKPHDAPINIVDYDPAWPGLFEREARRVREALGDVVLQLEHVGSIDRMLRFRDRLRAQPTERKLYEHAKRDLATRTWRHVQNYADAKTSIIEEILARAT